jgi:hypothetical protein
MPSPNTVTTTNSVRKEKRTFGIATNPFVWRNLEFVEADYRWKVHDSRFWKQVANLPNALFVRGFNYDEPSRLLAKNPQRQEQRRLTGQNIYEAVWLVLGDPFTGPSALMNPIDVIAQPARERCHHHEQRP